ncbi:hypothetical protein F5Y15DRAFT_416101 [Xylariaceae sp. FL0016]|nr:hypothetical protein F5Y15DRAFT_416101 [Xylariaceae sp. FL0016]
MQLSASVLASILLVAPNVLAAPTRHGTQAIANRQATHGPSERDTQHTTQMAQRHAKPSPPVRETRSRRVHRRQAGVPSANGWPFGGTVFPDTASNGNAGVPDPAGIPPAPVTSGFPVAPTGADSLDEGGPGSAVSASDASGRSGYNKKHTTSPAAAADADDDGEVSAQGGSWSPPPPPPTPISSVLGPFLNDGDGFDDFDDVVDIDSGAVNYCEGGTCYNYDYNPTYVYVFTAPPPPPPPAGSSPYPTPSYGSYSGDASYDGSGDAAPSGGSSYAAGASGEQKRQVWDATNGV